MESQFAAIRSLYSLSKYVLFHLGVVLVLKVLESGNKSGLSLGPDMEELLTAEGNGLFDRHLWLDLSTLLVTLQSGRFLRVSTSETNAKTMSDNVLQDEICSMSYTPNGYKIAVTSETEIKVLKLSDKFTIISSETIAHDASDLINQVHWTSDGQVGFVLF